VVIESWLNEQSSDENRGTVFSAYILINMTVLAVGQQMLLLDDPMTLQLFAVTSVLVSLAAVPVALSTSQPPRQLEDSKLYFRYAYNISPSGMLGSFSTGLANGAFWALAPVFIAVFATDLSLAAWFMTAGVLGGAAGQFPIGWLSDRIDRRYVLLGISIAGAAVSAIIWVLGTDISQNTILGMGFAWGALSFPVYTISVAHANDRAAPEDYVRLSSALLLMYGIGAITGPFIASGVMTYLGATGLYIYISVIHATFALYVLAFSLRRKAVAPDDTVDFSDSLTTALTSSQVYAEEGYDSEEEE
jgi:MFS family permease